MAWILGEPRIIRTVGDLDDLGLRQLVVAGTKYDGEDAPAETRLQGTDDEYEGNLMEVTIHPVLDGDVHLYDICSYMVGLECGDAPLRAQLQPFMRAAKLISFD